jgi:hypothetical protein
MKTTKNMMMVLFVLLSFVSFSSCKKEKLTDNCKISEAIGGSWFAVSSHDDSGDLIYAEGTTAITLTFKTNGTYSWVLSYTNPSAVPITYNGTYTYDDTAKTIKLKGSATFGSYKLNQDDIWYVTTCQKTRIEMYENTGVNGIGKRTMIWCKN